MCLLHVSVQGTFRKTDKGVVTGELGVNRKGKRLEMIHISVNTHRIRCTRDRDKQGKREHSLRREERAVGKVAAEKVGK